MCKLRSSTKNVTSGSSLGNWPTTLMTKEPKPTLKPRQTPESNPAVWKPTLSVRAHLWKDIFFMSSAWFSGMQPDLTSAATKSSSMVLNSEDLGFLCHTEQISKQQDRRNVGKHKEASWCLYLHAIVALSRVRHEQSNLLFGVPPVLVTQLQIRLPPLCDQVFISLLRSLHRLDLLIHFGLSRHPEDKPRQEPCGGTQVQQISGLLTHIPAPTEARWAQDGAEPSDTNSVLPVLSDVTLWLTKARNAGPIFNMSL